MKVLFVCSMGMSSAIVINALKNEALKQNINLEVHSVGTQEFENEIKNGYDLVMVAPQIRHRYENLNNISKENNTICSLITPQSYSPLGVKMLLDQILKEAKC